MCFRGWMGNSLSWILFLFVAACEFVFERCHRFYVLVKNETPSIFTNSQFDFTLSYRIELNNNISETTSTEFL